MASPPKKFRIKRRSIEEVAFLSEDYLFTRRDASFFGKMWAGSFFERRVGRFFGKQESTFVMEGDFSPEGAKVDDLMKSLKSLGVKDEKFYSFFTIPRKSFRKKFLGVFSSSLG
jgi:hypothetical protein